MSKMASGPVEAAAYTALKFVAWLLVGAACGIAVTVLLLR